MYKNVLTYQHTLWHKCIQRGTKYYEVVPAPKQFGAVSAFKNKLFSGSKMAVAALEELIAQQQVYSTQGWREKDVEQINLDSLYAAWIEQIDRIEGMFKQHIYENPKADQFDYRQHRLLLYSLLFAGENLAMTLLRLEKLIPIGHYIERVDAKLVELYDTLQSWHGKLEDQSDVPESFKQAIRELENGQIEPFDDAVRAS